MASTLQPERPQSRVRRFPLNVSSTLGRQRLVGAALLVILLGLFFGLSDPPRLDSVRDDVAAQQGVSRPAEQFAANRALESRQNTENCFQDFCFEEEQGVVQRWMDFSVAYIEVVAGAVVVALLAAAVVDGFLFPTAAGPGFGRRGLRSGSLRATLNAPALAIVFVLLSPVLLVSRLALGVVAALGLVAVAARWMEPGDDRSSLAVVDPAAAPEGWAAVVVDGSKWALRAAWRFFYRLVPLFVMVAFAGGIAIQYLTLDGVESLLGDHLLGVLLAATVGVLITVPMLWEIPLIAGLLLIGLGTAPAATLLFTAAVGGVATFRRTARLVRVPAAMRLAAAVWVVGVLGGVLVLGWQQVSEASVTPTVRFDGSTCTYSGPEILAPGSHDFTVVNEMPLTPETERAPMAVVIGRLAEGATIEGFASDVADDPTATLPSYFSEVATEEFIFPDTSESLPIVVHQPGRYAVTCMLGGGGFYVIAEFSMIQPEGWFEEFRDTFAATVAPEVFRVEP